MENFTGRVRGARPAYGQGVRVPPSINNGGEQLIVNGTPPLTEMVRLGQSYYGKGVVTSISLGNVLPTTLACQTLWNGEAANGKSYVLEGVGFISDVAVSAESFFQIYVAPSILPLAAAPATAEVGIIRPLQAGHGTYSGKAIISQNVGVTDVGWIPIGKPFNIGYALHTTIGVSGYVPVNGLFIIPPGFYIGAHICGTETSAEALFFFIWHEVQLELV